jgi:hypothetical protein
MALVTKVQPLQTGHGMELNAKNPRPMGTIERREFILLDFTHVALHINKMVWIRFFFHARV